VFGASAPTSQFWGLSDKISGSKALTDRGFRGVPGSAIPCGYLEQEAKKFIELM
jgi:hypothetical protein